MVIGFIVELKIDFSSLTTCSELKRSATVLVAIGHNIFDTILTPLFVVQIIIHIA